MNAIIKPEDYQMRPMRLEDLSQVMAIENDAYTYPWTEGIFRDCIRVGYLCRVLEHFGRIEGYGIMSFGAGEAHVLNLCIKKDSRCSGLGKLVLDSLLADARHFGADTALLEVRPSNVAAVHLYHKAGFSEVGTRKDYYPDDHGREDALILAMNLR
jgi:ribosomal-protein-alanine N-acetyltransferase